MYNIEYTVEARKNLRRLPSNISQLIVKKIILLSKDVYAPNNNVKVLNGVDGYRLRVGDYRVIYRINKVNLIIRIINIGHRQEVYK